MPRFCLFQRTWVFLTIALCPMTIAIRTMTIALGTLISAFCAIKMSVWSDTTSNMHSKMPDNPLKCHVLIFAVPSDNTHTHRQTQNVMPDLMHCLLEETTRLLLGGTCPHGQGCAERPCQLVPWLHTPSCAGVTCMAASAVVTTTVKISHSFKHAFMHSRTAMAVVTTVRFSHSLKHAFTHS